MTDCSGDAEVEVGPPGAPDDADVAADVEVTPQYMALGSAPRHSTSPRLTAGESSSFSLSTYVSAVCSTRDSTLTAGAGGAFEVEVEEGRGEARLAPAAPARLLLLAVVLNGDALDLAGAVGEAAAMVGAFVDVEV